MKTITTFIVLFLVAGICRGQAPVANFSISPNPACARSVIQITDLSANNPTAWSYTFSGGPGPGGMGSTSSLQNPTVSFNFAGTYTVRLVSSNASGSSQLAVKTITVLASPLVQINPAQANTCPGGAAVSISLNIQGSGAGGPYSYLWSNGASGQAIAVTPSVTTVYSVVVTATTGCTAQLSSTVNVANATVSIGSFPASICPGSSSTLTATGSLPGPFSYTWSTGASTRSISTASPGVYTVGVTNGNGCTAVQSYTLGSSSTLSLSVVANPSILCAGNTATLRVNGAGSYTWGSGATSPVTTVNPKSTTTYTVYGEYAACTGTGGITIPVSTTPTLAASANPATVCAGKAVLLTVSGAATYTWNSGSNAASLSVSPAVNTVYIVQGNNPGCPTRSLAVPVVVNANPTVLVSSSSDLICAGEVVAIGASGAAGYLWNNGSVSALVIVSPPVTTVYTVTGTNANGCNHTAVFTQSVSECAGIEERSIYRPFSVYPNPGEGEFKIAPGNIPENALVEVYNSMGQLVMRQEISDPGQVFKTEQRGGGIYLVKLSAGGVMLHTATLIVSGR